MYLIVNKKVSEENIFAQKLTLFKASFRMFIKIS